MKVFLGAMFCTLLAGCSTLFGLEFPSSYWCADRYLRAESRAFSQQNLDVALRSYPYVIAAARVLQNENAESRDHWIELPERMVPAEDRFRGETGFEAQPFWLKGGLTGRDRDQLVIAFAGSNDFWLFVVSHGT